MKDFLFSPEGRAYLLEAYVGREQSAHAIARERGTYANKVRRALLAHGIKPRGKSEAQKKALEHGRHAHPTRGRTRSPQERERISGGMARAWEGMTAGERRKRVAAGRRQWRAMSAADRAELLSLAGDGLRKAAAQGSSLERHLLDGLRAAGHEVSPRDAAGGATVDLVLPTLKVAVDVEGPSHHLPIWGEERLEKTLEADARKAQALVADGWVFVRVKCLSKTVSEYQKGQALDAVLAVLAEGNSSPRLVELEVK